MNKRIAYWSQEFKTYIKNRDFYWKKKLIVFSIILCSLIALDTITKILALRYLAYNQPVTFIPNFLGWQRINNSGIAFGVSFNLAGVIAISVFLIILAWAVAAWSNNWGVNISLMTISSGALANLINRIWNHGTVIDFIRWELFPPESIFNLADFMVVGGCVLLVLVMLGQMLYTFYQDRAGRNHHPTQLST